LPDLQNRRKANVDSFKNDDLMVESPSNEINLKTTERNPLLFSTNEQDTIEDPSPLTPNIPSS